jgi:D-alanyl-D-alanine carboxypeptidase (penicillin-binding protein 5/6)
MTGTSAQIAEGEVYTVEQLLYAMMLPSGNDAALALAEWGGCQLRQGPGETPPGPSEPENVRAFLKEMNALAGQFGMKFSRWANPHGLANVHNKSTAYDMARLCSIALQDPAFRKLVATRHYKAMIRTTEGVRYAVEWENTNKLLSKPGFFGIKTGVTASAGPCLASCYGHEGHEFVVVVLRTNKVSRRFKETKVLLGAVLRELAAREDRWKGVLLHFRTHKQPEDSEEDSAEEEFDFRGRDNPRKQWRRERLVHRLC